MSATIKFIYAMSLILFIGMEFHLQFCETDEDCRRRGSNQYWVYKCINHGCEYVQR
ncbi:putative Late nodulin [Medicago truncatula]|uniref:Nodule Cysteine-Rich (NCR) secreted peptide n=1 Tax=Medicago truncatula TaxID=3880 RepID=G7I3W5_MEDTR|nr:Nodule Cysteine-Rich (NCR) secreted peptide [Medicago truncatula]RHN80314.1 putative Late nodulin [Medicago truncatula]